MLTKVMPAAMHASTIVVPRTLIVFVQTKQGMADADQGDAGGRQRLILHSLKCSQDSILVNDTNAPVTADGRR